MAEEKSERTDKKKKAEGELDIFIADSIYPEAEPIFTATFKPVDEIKDECLVVLDHK